MSGTRVENRKRSPWFGVDKPDLAALAAACERRQLAYVRSVYFAILETANDQRSQVEAMASQAELADRAGVSVSTLKNCVTTLTEAGLLEVHSGRLKGEPNVWTLQSPDDGGVAVPRLPGGRATATGWAHDGQGGSRATATPMETGQEGSQESLLAAQAESADRVWEHYLAARKRAIPRSNGCKRGDIENLLIRNALKVRDAADCCAAIDGLFRSQYHLDGGFIGIKYALRGGGNSPDPGTTIDRLANGRGGTRLKDRLYRGLAWDELTPHAQASAKDAAAQGLEVWDGGKDSWEGAEERRAADAAVRAEKRRNGQVPAGAWNLAGDD